MTWATKGVSHDSVLEEKSGLRAGIYGILVVGWVVTVWLEGVMPLGAYRRTGRDIDDGARERRHERVGTTVADEIGAGHVRDRAVVLAQTVRACVHQSLSRIEEMPGCLTYSGIAHCSEVALIHPVHVHPLKDRVGMSGRENGGKRRESGDHLCA